jgi:ABC-2 type transport system permease protein
MNGILGFWRRFTAVFLKEFVQMRRDRMTFGMMVGVPLLQLVLFGYAINSDPKALPTALIAADNSTFARSLTRSLENSEYFRFLPEPVDEAEGDRLLRMGEVQFVLNIPEGFQRDVVRGRHPAILIEADATDPAATSNAIGALMELDRRALGHDLKGALRSLAPGEAPFEIRIHRRYNEENITQHNIVPGLMGVVLTMTMVIMTGLAMTRERARGTMESLLALPIRPLEVMLGKIVPYIFVGYVQIGLILVAAAYLFQVPMLGSIGLLSGAAILFIAANLAMGFTFSTLARNQLQAMQMSFFFLMPSILLSGFAFPFRGMPAWAQAIGEALPNTHFLRIVRGLMLKGASPAEIATEIGALVALLIAVTVLALSRYRVTLD